MASEQAIAVLELLKAIPRDTEATIEEQRAAAEATWPMFATEPSGVEYEHSDAGGVRALWVTPEEAAPGRVLLYLHGGGYSSGSVETHKRLVAHIATAIGCRACLLGYRLAPEHPFPAAVNDAVAGYHHLLGLGLDPRQLLIGGDSAGGGLSVAALVALRDAGAAMPAGAILLSPWTDLAGTGESLTTRKDVDPFIDPVGIVETGALYLGATDPREPLASPIYAELGGLPPLLIHVGDSEVLLDDSVRLADVAVRAGVETELEIWPEMIHVFQMGAGNIPESDASIAAIGAWARGKLGDQASA